MKKARLYWDGAKWVLELFKDDSWHFSKAWNVEQKEKESYSIDIVNDSIVCEIANLQELGYDVRVSVCTPKDYD